MEQKSVTGSETDKLNNAVETLRSFCESQTHCGGCPFKKDKLTVYENPCKFGSFYPELWYDLEIKEIEDHE